MGYIMSKLFKIAVGSTNPVKIEAARVGCLQALGVIEEDGVVEIECFGFNVSSQVSDQPMSDEETKVGSINRAKAAYEAYKLSKGEPPSYSVGLEGGVSDNMKEMECFAYISIFNGGDKFGVAKTAVFCLPERMREQVLAGVELGVADDNVFRTINAKQHKGTVGALTKGLISRTDYYVQATILAFIPFIHKELY